MLAEKLQNYINQTEDATINYELGEAYQAIGQIASAVSFYLRSAERTNDTHMQYYLLLKLAQCFQTLGERVHTEQTLIHKAIALYPNRPEAYFMAAKLSERKYEWQECCTYTNLGLELADFDLPPMNISSDYLGKISLLFQKSLGCYYTGLVDQAKDIMIDLKLNHAINDEYTNIIDNNLISMGYQPPEKTFDVQFNNHPRKGFWVVDNFYANPDEIRKFALAQEFDQGGLGRGYIGRRTFKQFLFPGLKEQFEKIMGEKITAWEDHGMNGKFQYSMEGEPLVYHCDSQKWAGMIYLTPNAPFETGTGSFAVKGTQAFHNSQKGIMAAFRGDGAQNLDKTIFEPVDSIGNVYNRLVIFNAGYLHAALGYFGYKPENSRLWQMFFFD